MIVRMLTSAEGEYSLLAGNAYDLPAKLAASLVAGGAAEAAPGARDAETPAGNVPAPHHAEGYQEFRHGPYTGEPEKLEAEPKPKRKRAAAKRSSAKRSSSSSSSRKR